MESESGFEGAEVPSSIGRPEDEKGVSFNSKHFWRELGTALGMQATPKIPNLCRPACSCGAKNLCPS
jgi:hypothetical protein